MQYLLPKESRHLDTTLRTYNWVTRSKLYNLPFHLDNWLGIAVKLSAPVLLKHVRKTYLQPKLKASVIQQSNIALYLSDTLFTLFKSYSEVLPLKPT